MKPKSSTNYKKIVDAVLDQINHGQLQKGDKLPTELSLATKFDVSRTCVREAIKSLEAMGIVQSIQGSGSYITNTPELSINRPICALFALSNSTLENVLDLRIVLETDVCRDIIRSATDDEIERLKIAAGWEEGMIPRTKTQRVCAAFVLACLTGMRSGEMMRIERSWIRGNVLWIPMEATKTEHFRKIALSDRARKILDDVVSLGIEPSIWGLSDGSRDSLWRKIRDRAGLGEVRDSQGRLIEQALHFHDGRATFCTWAASPGEDGAPRLDVMSLARQTGHRSVKMLMRYYRPDVSTFADRLK